MASSALLPLVSAGSPALTPPGLVLLFCPGEVQSPLFCCVCKEQDQFSCSPIPNDISPACGRWQGMGEGHLFRSHATTGQMRGQG